MNISGIHVIFFDIDGTLYPLQGIAEKNFQNSVNFLCKNLHISSQEAIKQLETNGILPYASKKNNSITQYILSLGFSIEYWNEYRFIHYPVDYIDSVNSVDVDVLFRLKKKYKIIALSSNMYAISCKILDKIGIQREIFDDIFCVDKNPLRADVFSKKDIMLRVSMIMNIPCSLMLSIGDRFSSDIKPILELGGMGALVSCPKDISEIADVLLNKNKKKENASWDFYYE